MWLLKSATIAVCRAKIDRQLRFGRLHTSLAGEVQSCAHVVRCRHVITANQSGNRYRSSTCIFSRQSITRCLIDALFQGVARGNRIALYARSSFQYVLFHTGCFVQKWAWTTVVLGWVSGFSLLDFFIHLQSLNKNFSLILYTVCCAGLKDVIIETDLVKLWVQREFAS